MRKLAIVVLFLKGQTVRLTVSQTVCLYKEFYWFSRIIFFALISIFSLFLFVTVNEKVDESFESSLKLKNQIIPLHCK